MATRPTSGPLLEPSQLLDVRDELEALISRAQGDVQTSQVALDVALSALDRLELPANLMQRVDDALDATHAYAGASAVAAAAAHLRLALSRDRRSVDSLRGALSDATKRADELQALLEAGAGVASRGPGLRAGSDLIGRIRAQAERVEVSKQALGDLVVEAVRTRSATWSDIAGVTGLSSEGARKRWGRSG